jgi:hypothetical protein
MRHLIFPIEDLVLCFYYFVYLKILLGVHKCLKQLLLALGQCVKAHSSLLKLVYE